MKTVAQDFANQMEQVEGFVDVIIATLQLAKTSDEVMEHQLAAI